MKLIANYNVEMIYVIKLFRLIKWIIRCWNWEN